VLGEKTLDATDDLYDPFQMGIKLKPKLKRPKVEIKLEDGSDVNAKGGDSQARGFKKPVFDETKQEEQEDDQPLHQDAMTCNTSVEADTFVKPDPEAEVQPAIQQSLFKKKRKPQSQAAERPAKKQLV